MSRTNTFGRLLRERREAAKKSLRQLAKELGISPVYLGEVERGIRATLAQERWPKLLESLPNIQHEELWAWASQDRPIQLNLSTATPEYRDIGHALARRVNDRDLSRDEIRKLLEILGRKEDE